MLSFDPNSLSLPAGHYINGAFRPGPTEIELFRASDGAAYAGCAIADAATVDDAVEAASAALKANGWGEVAPRERRNLLCRWADLIEAEAASLAALECVGSTRLISQAARMDIAVTAEQIRFFAEFADKEGGMVAPTGSETMGMVVDEPYGVVAAITPWNFPVSMAGWKLGPALAAGNAVVIKPSELTPFSTLRLAELAVRAGLPAGLLNVVTGDGSTTGNALTGHAGIAKVSFTGSTGAGRAIMGNIARHGVKPMTLELGGKSPQLVFADADLAAAATAIAGSILFNAGQACVAGARVIVDRRVADALTERLKLAMSDVMPGPTWDDQTTFSPIVSERQLQRIEGLVSSAVAAGAETLIGGAVFDRDGYFFQPTLLSSVPRANPILGEEVFGPVLTLETFEDEDEALALADHEIYGLAAGIFTKDLSRALRVMRRLESGTVWINRYSRSRDHILPTGGYKQSGFGKDLGREVYHANRRHKSVLIQL